jgi:putative hydrolase of the HAD superfamily
LTLRYVLRSLLQLSLIGYNVVVKKQIDTLIFDLDDTLYSPENGLWEHVSSRIASFMIDTVGIPPEAVDSTRQFYLDTYGTTLQGLSKDYQVNVMDYLEYIHPKRMESFIPADSGLSAMLNSLSQRKIIFTNAYRPHAERVLECLGVSEHFEIIIDILDTGLKNKPQPEAYETLMKVSSISYPESCLYVDDRLANLLPASELGMTTVHISPEKTDSGGHFHIKTITELDKAVPELRNFRK